MARWLIPVVVALIAAAGLFAASRHGVPTAVDPLTVPGTDTDPGQTSTGPCRAAGTPQGGYRHVVWILMGTAGYSDVTSPAGIQTRQYAQECGIATSYEAVALPSFPNVPALVTGSTGGITRNHCDPQSDPCPAFSNSLFKQVQSWKVYVGGMKAPCSTAANPVYDPRSNPPLWSSVPPAQCRRRDVPLGNPATGSFAGALKTGALPRFSIVVPDLCHSMTFARGCLGRGATQDDYVASGDHWLGARLGQITSSAAYRSGSTVVMVTWTSGSNTSKTDCISAPDAGCHVATLVLSRSVPPRIAPDIPFTHYSLLKTTEQLLGVPLLGGARKGATRSMRLPFGL